MINGGEPRVFLIGARWRHHARHSGYGGFGRHVGTPIRPFRVPLKGRSGRRFEAKANAMRAGAHMMLRRGAMFHALDGDRDLEILIRFAQRGGVPLLATMHAPPGRIRRDVLLRAIERLHTAVLLSSTQRDWFSQLLPEERLFVVPHGVDTSFFSPARTPARVRRREPTLVTVGRNFRDFETLGAALQLVRHRCRSLRTLAIGIPSSGKHALARACEDRITFLNKVDDDRLRLAYRSADAVVFALTDSTANNSLLEAMACGAPVVATEVGGVREYVGDAALLCVPEDPRALADHITRVLDDRGLALTLARAARTRSLIYDYERVAEQMAAVYRSAATLDAA
jgi:glycosyltransferase involved in cell wall biosynthesis